MNFKRTSSVLSGPMMSTEFNSCEVVCHGSTSAKQEGAQLSDAADNIAVVTCHPYILPNATDQQFTALFSSPSSPRSSSNESTFASVQEVCPVQKLVARDVNGLWLKNRDTSQDKQLLVCQDGGSAKLDLRSERNFERGIDTETESAKKTVQSDCERCTALQKVIDVTNAKNYELTKRLNDLTEKHKMFIVSNCQLNEENDCLKIEKERLKLQLCHITFENSQLRSQKDNLVKPIAAKESQWPGRSWTDSSSTYLPNADPSHPNSLSLSENVSSVIRNDLQEAIILSCQQKSDVCWLQEKITCQNETIKTLCSQLQEMTGLGKRPSSNELHEGINNAALPQQENLPSRVQQRLTSDTSDRFSSAFHKLADATRVPQKNIDEGNGILLPRDITIDENLCTRDVGCLRALDTSSSTKTHQKTLVVASNGARQLQCKDVKSPKAGDQQFNFREDHGNFIQESSSTLLPRDANIHAALPTASTAPMVQSPYIQDQLLHTEIVACPFCGREFLGSNVDFQQTFEAHVATCEVMGPRQCPMCLKTLPGLSQAEFDNHVDDHFESVFEVLAP